MRLLAPFFFTALLSFYEFPELVQLRAQIGHRLCDQLTK